MQSASVNTLIVRIKMSLIDKKWKIVLIKLSDYVAEDNLT